MKSKKSSQPLIYLKLLEGLAKGVLLLVILALVLNQSLLQIGEYYSVLARYVMLIAISLLSITSIVRTFGYTYYRWLVVLGTLLVALGAIIFYGLPSYFHQSLATIDNYWLLVCIYSLPAVVLEGGILTLFTWFNESYRTTTGRERTAMTGLMIVYACVAVGTNFLAVHRVIDVTTHVTFSRVIVSVVFVFIAALSLQHVRRR